MLKINNKINNKNFKNMSKNISYKILLLLFVLLLNSGKVVFAMQEQGKGVVLENKEITRDKEITGADFEWQSNLRLGEESDCQIGDSQVGDNQVRDSQVRDSQAGNENNNIKNNNDLNGDSSSIDQNLDVSDAVFLNDNLSNIQDDLDPVEVQGQEESLSRQASIGEEDLLEDQDLENQDVFVNSLDTTDSDSLDEKIKFYCNLIKESEKHESVNKIVKLNYQDKLDINNLIENTYLISNEILLKEFDWYKRNYKKWGFESQFIFNLNKIINFFKFNDVDPMLKDKRVSFFNKDGAYNKDPKKFGNSAIDVLEYIKACVSIVLKNRKEIFEKKLLKFKSKFSKNKYKSIQKKFSRFIFEEYRPNIQGLGLNFDESAIFDNGNPLRKSRYIFIENKKEMSEFREEDDYFLMKCVCDFMIFLNEFAFDISEKSNKIKIEYADLLIESSKCLNLEKLCKFLDEKIFKLKNFYNKERSKLSEALKDKKIKEKFCNIKIFKEKNENSLDENIKFVL